MNEEKKCDTYLKIILIRILYLLLSNFPINKYKYIIVKLLRNLYKK